jgi:hypothetical protein
MPSSTLRTFWQSYSDTFRQRSALCEYFDRTIPKSYGYFKVIDHKQVEYTLLDLTINKEKRYHSTQMKPFLFNPLRTNPTDVSRKDYLEIFIETILQHTGDIKRLSTL